MKESNIKQVLESKNIKYKDQSSIYAIFYKNKLNDLFTPDYQSFLNGNHYIINFNDAGLSIIWLNYFGKLSRDNILSIDKKDINNINFKKKMFYYLLTIQTCTGSKLLYKVSRITGGWHKRNLKNLLELYGGVN